MENWRLNSKIEMLTDLVIKAQVLTGKFFLDITDDEIDVLVSNSEIAMDIYYLKSYVENLKYNSCLKFFNRMLTALTLYNSKTIRFNNTLLSPIEGVDKLNLEGNPILRKVFLFFLLYPNKAFSIQELCEYSDIFEVNETLDLHNKMRFYCNQINLKLRKHNIRNLRLRRYQNKYQMVTLSRQPISEEP